MKRRQFLQLAGATVAAPVLLDATLRAQPADPLPSWNAGASRQAIVDFVTKGTKEGSPGFVPVPERIAVFDNDGTLWSEQPMYFQLAFTLDRVKALAPHHPHGLRLRRREVLLGGLREKRDQGRRLAHHRHLPLPSDQGAWGVTTITAPCRRAWPPRTARPARTSPSARATASSGPRTSRLRLRGWRCRHAAGLR